MDRDTAADTVKSGCLTVAVFRMTDECHSDLSPCNTSVGHIDIPLYALFRRLVDFDLIQST